MSWLHKFFDLFLGESEEDAERETKPAQIPQQQEVHHPEGQLKRLEDPKIYYEYPKGKFRFPVVPDGYKNHDLRRRRTPSDEPKSAPRPSAAPYRERPRNEEEQHTYQAAEPAKKPFKPTNIPSPVYGFNQKPSVKKDVPKKPSETLNEPDKSVKEKVTLLSEEIERERGYPASDTQAHSKKESPFFPDTQFKKQPSGVLNRKETEHDEALAKRPAEPSGNKVPFESGVQQPEKEEPSFPAEHAEKQTPPEMLTDTAAEGLSDSEVGREEPATAKEEQREQQPEKIEEPVFSAEHDEEQTAPESQTESVSEDEKAKEPSDSPVYNHHENAAEGAESPFVQEEQMDIRQEEPLFTDHEYSSEALAQAETVAKESEEPSESIINNHYDTLGEAQETKIDVQPDSHTELEKTERLEQGSKSFTATLENRQEIRADKPREASEEPKKGLVYRRKGLNKAHLLKKGHPFLLM